MHFLAKCHVLNNMTGSRVVTFNSLGGCLRTCDPSPFDVLIRTPLKNIQHVGISLRDRDLWRDSPGEERLKTYLNRGEEIGTCRACCDRLLGGRSGRIVPDLNECSALLSPVKSYFLFVRYSRLIVVCSVHYKSLATIDRILGDPGFAGSGFNSPSLYRR
jgi:hypothetical protein